MSNIRHDEMTTESTMQRIQSLVGEGAVMAATPLGQRGDLSGVTADPTLTQRVSAGTATADEIAVYRNQRAARDAKVNEARAERSREYAEMNEPQRNAKLQQLQKELDRVSDEMRPMAPLSPLFRQTRRIKLALAHEIEDLKAGAQQRQIEDSRNDAQNLSEDKRQLNVARNFPLADANEALVSEGTDAPGSEQPSESEQNPNIDSKAMLKGAGAIRTIQGDKIVTEIPDDQKALASRAVNGQ